MHKPFFVVDAFLQGDHRLGTADALYIVYLENNVLGVGSIPRPYLTEDIEFSRGNMGDRDIGNLRQPLQYEFRLVGLFEKYADIGNEGIPELNIIQSE